MSRLTGENVLVTGGCGSIGSRLVERLLDHDPSVVRVFDNDEEGLFELHERLERHTDDLRFLLGDVRDERRLQMAVEDVDVLFHAAALKHVGLNEYNPFEAIQTNVMGTQNVVRAALEEDVDSFVTISTDKASNPTSVMGATKLLAERVSVAANTYAGDRDIQFACVRFGNVAGSSGSVVPVFLRQAEEGGPITVTNPEMTRFVLPIDEAVDLVFDAHDRMQGGETFVLKMPAFELRDLAEVVRDEFAPRFGHAPDDVEIRITGARPGERVHEKLVSKDELDQTVERDDMFVITPQVEYGYANSEYGGRNSLQSEYTSKDVDPISKADIVELIEDVSAVETPVPRQ